MKIYPQRDLNGNVDSCFAPNSKKLETTQMYLKREKDKQIAIYPFNAILDTNKKERTIHLATCHLLITQDLPNQILLLFHSWLFKHVTKM